MKRAADPNRSLREANNEILLGRIVRATLEADPH